MARLIINRAGVQALLRGPELEQAVRRAASDIANVARAGAPATTAYDVLDVQVQSTRRGGANGDRVQAHVVIAPPVELGWRDRTRFEALVAVARAVSR